MSSPEKAPRTAVLLCGDLANLGAGLNLEELRSSLETAFPSIAIELVPALCEHLAQLSSVVARQSATRAVLGLCSGEYSQIELQTRARKAGLDFFGLEVVPLGTLCSRVHPQPQATRKARVLLAAAIARARAFPGNAPEHAKPYFLPREQKISRRSLFTLPPLGYQPVPSILRERCRAEAGCQLCARACPRDALRKVSGRLLLNKTKCESCGVCLSVCPREAIDFPSWSLPQFEAQLATLLDPPALIPDSFSLLFICQRAVSKLEELAQQGISYSHHWLPVIVPCLGMITPTWLFQILAHGAERVTLIFCGAQCPFGQAQTMGGRVNFCHQLLRLLGQDPKRVQVFTASHPGKLIQHLQKSSPQRSGGYQSRLSENGLCLGTLEGAFQAIQHLASASTALSTIALEHSYSPFGVLELRAEGCTGCMVCAEACPTGALASEHDGAGISLTFKASLCTGCGMCADICPESAAKVLRVRKITDLHILFQDKMVLQRHQLLICQSCGASIASQAMLRRLEASLVGNNETLRTALMHYCPSCRLSFAVGAKSSYIQPLTAEDSGGSY